MKSSPLLAISQRLNNLDASKQTAFRKKLAEQGINSWQLPIVANAQDQYPLSLAQQRFLVAEKMTERSIYNLCSVIKFDLSLNTQSLENAVNQLINRHQVMKTHFHQNAQGQWHTRDVKHVQPVILVPEKLNFLDEQVWLHAEFTKEQSFKFDLEKDQPFRIHVFKSEAHYYLFVTIHHVAFDAWSFEVFNQELALLYLAVSKGEEIALPNLPIQYKDYAQWQSQWLNSEDFAKQQEYWSQQLLGLPEPLDLPFDFKRSKHRNFEGKVETLHLDHELSLSIRQAINKQSSTLFVYLQTAFSWLLAKHSSQSDFCFGSSVANRQRPELSTMVGPLLNTLVLRHRINPDDNFKQALDGFKLTASNAFEHQDYPYEYLAKLTTASEQEHNQNEQLFRVMFIHVGLANDEQIQLGDTKGEVVTPDQNNARFDLSLRVIEHDDQTISLDLEYSTELFRPETISYLLNDYQHIISSILSKPELPFSQLSLVSTLSELKGEELAQPPSTIDEKVISYAVGEHGKKIALFEGADVTGNENSVDYATLNQHVSLIALWLESHGINLTESTQPRIAILMSRTPLQVKLMLASWRLGAVCVMLDPKQPIDRLNAICDDAEVELVVSDKAYGLNTPKEVQFDDDFKHSINNTTQINDRDLAVKSKTNTNAYMLYTSGSTGKPKGIVVSHQAVSHYAAAISQQFPQPSGSRWLTLATVAADLGLTSVLAALYQGQCLLLPNAETISDPNALSQFLLEHPADCLKITPSHLNALLSVEQPISMLPKRCLFLGGEGLNHGLFKKIKQIEPELTVVNHYGPSESTVGITSHEIDVDWQNTLSNVAPLGMPLPGNIITLRNKHGEVVPRGAMGELCVSSLQLAQGYWKNAEQTNKAFISPDQDFNHSSALDSYSLNSNIINSNSYLYYRTGDIAKINHVGYLEFIGRADDQVKCRGYRVELDEISHWLSSQDEINNAIVLMVPSITQQSNNQRVKQNDQQATIEQPRDQLIAWLSLTEGHTSKPANDSLNRIKTKMANSLPDYMLPDLWQVLDELPLNDNGKIDRKNLPMPTLDVDSKDKEKSHLDLTNQEHTLAQIWCEILGLDEVKASDSFFALGGDSIMSLQMIGMAIARGMKLTPGQIAQNPLLSDMAVKAALLPSFDRRVVPNSEQEVNQQNNKNSQGSGDTQSNLATAQVIADVFSKVLSRESISVNDDFFALGGDSILTLQFIALAKLQGLLISPKLFLDNPTPLLLANTFANGLENSPNIENTGKTLEQVCTDSFIVESNISKVNTGLAHTLSAAQQRIWFIQQLDPTSTAYNLPAAFHITGHIDTDKLLMAAKALVEKHLMLRVKYTQEKKSGVAVQQVIESYQPLSVHSATSFELASEKAHKLAEHHFDLSTGHVLALDLVPCTNSMEQSTNESWILVFNIHHIATDGWSMGLLIQDLLHLYQSNCDSADLANFSENLAQDLNYLDWSFYQSKLQLNKKTSNYWLNRLADMPHQLDFSFDHPLPNKQSYFGGTYENLLSESTVKKVDDYAKVLGTTPFTLLLAGFQLLLWRYSGQEDFAIGIPVSGREDARTQNMVGVFINTVVNRALISPQLPTEQWLTQQIKATQDDLNHQEMQLETLLNLLNPERNVARPPVFQVVFNYQNDQQGNRTVSLPDVSFSSIEHDEVHTKFELSFNLLKRDGLSLQIEYNKALLEHSTIKQLFNDYLSILNWLPEAKQTPLSSLVVESSNNALALANSPISKDLTVANENLAMPTSDVNDFITRFEYQARTKPDSIAVIDQQGSYCYNEINDRANQLAHWIHEQGVAEGELVAFSLPRNNRMLVTLLAIQKAGAAYLPLDHKQPIARLTYIIEHAKPMMVIVDATTSAAMVNSKSDHVCLSNLTELDEVLLSKPKVNLSLAIQPTQLAYTLYTSGSTGKPKGVEIERGNFALFLQAIESIVPEFTRILALTTITFDIAGLELCLPLVTGNCVVIANEDQQKDNVQLAELIQVFNVDLVQATPATWEMLSAIVDAHASNNSVLKNTHAICGGEALTLQLAERLTRHCKSVLNVYGPTEATVWSSYYPITNENKSFNVPIGRALPNNTLYVLDKQLSLVPFGVIGELYIAGSILARGYRNAEKLTAQAFIEHPKYGRLYKTGDQVKWLKSQQLMFVGRVDFQLKHRGYRIEPGEIETALSTHPEVSQAVVTMQKQMLVAHVVMNEQDNIIQAMTNEGSGTELNEESNQEAIVQNNKRFHEHLNSFLPDYMVPQHFQYLATLPLNTNGKVDRTKLTFELNKPSSLKQLASLTEQESLLAEIWCDLLGLENVDKDDNFFLLGGHSLLATQLRARLNESSMNIPLKSLFEAPVLSEQAKLLTETKYKMIPLLSELSEVPKLVPLSDAQKRLWFMQQLDLENTSFNMQIAVEITGQLKAEVLKKAIKDVTAKQPILQTVYIENNGEPVQSYQPTLNVPFLEKRFEQGVSKDVIESQLANAASYSFSLEAESPLRLNLYQLSDDRFIFQLVQHHIASDAWSMTLLLDLIVEAYQQISNNIIAENTLLSSLNNRIKPSYLDYAHWQNTAEITVQQSSSLNFWRQSLAGVPTVLELPSDRQRLSKNEQQGDVVHVVVPKGLHQSLNKLAHDNKTSLFMLLLSVYGVLIHQHTKRQDMIIGADVANREHHQTQDMLGFFVNLLPLRLQPKATLRFNDFLQQVKLHCLNSFDHQSVPFEQIVEAINPERISGMHPLIQILFVMQNTPDTRLNESELSISPIETKQHHAKFDCALFANTDKRSGELLLNWVFNCQLFNRETIERLSQSYFNLLEKIVNQPSAPINNLFANDRTQKKSIQSMATTTSPKRKASSLNKLSKLSKLKKTKPLETLVEIKPLTQERSFPLLVECKSKSLDPLTWARQNQQQIMTWLETHAGIVFRGFNLPTPFEFEQFCLAIYPELYAQYGDLPKNEIGSKIYKSTPYPNDQMIMFHNESSHQHQWPRRQWFYCSESAAKGGATPIVDCREMYLRLPETIRTKLEQKQLCYVRNFSNLDVSWQHFFKTEKHSDVEKICQESGIDYTWYGEDNLRISQVCPAIITHPLTQEKSFFNQIQLHHYSFLEQDVKQHFLEICQQDELPRNVFYGDLSPLEQEVIDIISELYETCAVRFDWQAGDVVMLDNMLAAHARDPFEGKRKIAVAMGDIYQPAPNKDNSELCTPIAVSTDSLLINNSQMHNEKSSHSIINKQQSIKSKEAI
jgi:amino acid adenylation domain-containing protein